MTASTSTEQLIGGVDFVALPTHDVAAVGRLLRRRRSACARSVYMPERNFAEFETGNLTLSIIDAEKMGLEHHPQPQRDRAARRRRGRGARDARSARRASSTATRSTRACATWRSSPTRKATR